MKKFLSYLAMAAVVAVVGFGCCACRQASKNKINKPLTETKWHLVKMMETDAEFDEGKFNIVFAEVAFYLKTLNEYGLPLDERRNYTKSDWIVWSATMADSKAEFEQFIAPMYRFYNETVDRVPMGDWYNTDSKHHIMFRARSVVGGYFIKLLEERLLNKE